MTQFKQRVAVAATVGAISIALPFVSSWEGLRLSAYRDPIGIPTICYGSTKNVKIGDKLTKEQCDQLLSDEIKVYLDAVDQYIMVPMPDTRRAALTSFAYNVGIENFKRSTVRKLMNAGQTKAACNQLTRWVFASGIKLRGLIRRRDAERDLCLIGT